LQIRDKILPPLRTEHGRGIREEAGNWYSLDSLGWFALSQVSLEVLVRYIGVSGSSQAK
jgi:hypothetical protein